MKYVVIKLQSIGEDSKKNNNSKDKVWEQRTSTVMENLNPSWDESKTFHSLDCLDPEGKGIEILFQVFDYDLLSKDDFLGSTSWIIKSEEIEKGREYEEMLPLRDGKKGAGILFVQICISNQENPSDECNFKICKPFKTIEYCLPKEFSLTNSSEGSNNYLASFVNFSNGISFETVLKEIKESYDFGSLAKKIRGDTLAKLKTKYTNVDLMSIRENVRPSPHARNKIISQIFEFDIFIEHQQVKIWETIRVIQYSNSFIGVFTYGGKDDSFTLKNAVEEIPLLSESVVFLQ